MPEQLILPLSRDESSLRAYFEKATGHNISLAITDNTTSMVFLRKDKNTTVVRLHRIFLGAGTDVLAEIAEFIRKGKNKTPLLTAFVKQNAAGIRRKTARASTLRTAGKYYDLRDIFGSLNNEYFGGRLVCPLTWGAGSSKYAARKRTLGSYNRHTNTIRINPILDRKKTPAYFVEFVMYHEMLHADMETVTKNGKRLVHCKEFRRREKLFRHYERAMGWEKEGI